MNITPLFPISLGTISNFVNENERLKLFKYITSVKHEPHGVIRGDGVTTFPGNIKFSNFIDKNIKNRLEDQVNKYGMIYGVGNNLKVNNIWSNIQNSGSILNEHCHPKALISGALYINVNDSCSVTFHNPNNYIYFTHIVERTPFSYEWQKIPVKNGDLLLFPSWMRHGHHDHVNEMDNRVVISFNSGLS